MWHKFYSNLDKLFLSFFTLLHFQIWILYLNWLIHLKRLCNHKVLRENIISFFNFFPELPYLSSLEAITATHQEQTNSNTTYGCRNTFQLFPKILNLYRCWFIPVWIADWLIIPIIVIRIFITIRHTAFFL